MTKVITKKPVIAYAGAGKVTIDTSIGVDGNEDGQQSVGVEVKVTADAFEVVEEVFKKDPDVIKAILARLGIIV